MTTNLRRIGIWGAAILAVALPVLASAQQSELTKTMGIDQKLGASVPKDAQFTDETGHTIEFGSLLKGRPVLVVPMMLKCEAGCLVLRDGLQKTLFSADHPNQRKLIKKEGRNVLQVGQDLDIVFLSLDPTEGPKDGSAIKAQFQDKVGYPAEPVTVLTGSLTQIHKVTDAIGFRYFYDPQKNVLNNATGSVLLTPDGRISAYTIGNDFPTIVMERNVDTARSNAIGTRADDSNKFGCVQLPPDVVARRGKIEAVYTGAGLIFLAGVIYWIGSMLRSERKANRDLGGQPGGA